MKKKRKVRLPHSEVTKQKMRDAHRARIEAKKSLIEEKPVIKMPVERHNRDILQEAVTWASGK